MSLSLGPRPTPYAYITAHPEQHSQIVRMLNDVSFAKNSGGGGGVEGEVDLCPASLQEEVDAMNEFVYEKASKPYLLLLLSH